MNRTVFVVACAMPFAAAAHSSAAIIAASTPIALEILTGSPLIIVPPDGMPVGTVYGHAPSLTPGIALPTPIGPMGFSPSHERISPGHATSSGTFHALPMGSPSGIAGSDIHPPVGATAIDFLIGPFDPGPAYVFEITAVGTSSSLTITTGVTTEPFPAYVGFAAFGETLVDISIVKLPFGATMSTWYVSELRVLPAPASVLAFAPLAWCIRRRR